MRNSYFEELRGLQTTKSYCLLLLMAVVGLLLAVPSSAFAKPSAGIQPTVGSQSGIATATFVDISQDALGKPIYPRDTKSKNLKVGDTLDFTVGGVVETGKYTAKNMVTTKNNQSLVLTVAASNPKTAALLDLQPASMELTGHNINDCQKTTVFVCSARVLSRQSNKSNLNWIAYTDVLGKITFTPPNGSLAPGQNVVVKITLPLDACRAPAGLTNLFYFQGPKNTHTILWTC